MSKSNFLQDKVLPISTKIGSNRYMLALRNGITAITPLMIIGSIFLLITNLPIQAWKDFIAPYAAIISLPNKVCFGNVALVTVVSVTYQIAKELKINRLFTSFFALVSFVLVNTANDGVVNSGNFGASGLFMAIIIALTTSKFFEFFEKKKIGIKLPNSVPTMVADAFNSIISGGAVIVFFWIITGILGFDLNGLISKVLSPLVIGLNSLPGILFVVFISCFIWCCGINESAIMGVTYPVWYALLAENTAAFEAGQVIPNLGAYGFQYFGVWMSGTGCTIGLIIWLLRSRVKMYRTLGGISLPPAIFNINEPVTFGFPIVFNPVMMIPYIGVPLILSAGTYVLMYFNIINRVALAIPWTTPPLISGFLCTGGDIRASAWQAVGIVISAAVYYPFFKFSEKIEIEKEAGGKVEAAG
ncbi:MAG: PTS transporter subunit EIIC [Treponema sp.]|jgi:PTS system cellobiose-specific IIC component|nr:PTS transporter subunit EIIC [Treponema sp.]